MFYFVFYHFCAKDPTPVFFCQRENGFGSSPQLMRGNGCELVVGENREGGGSERWRLPVHAWRYTQGWRSWFHPWCERRVEEIGSCIYRVVVRGWQALSEVFYFGNGYLVELSVVMRKVKPGGVEVGRVTRTCDEHSVLTVINLVDLIIALFPKGLSESLPQCISLQFRCLQVKMKWRRVNAF